MIVGSMALWTMLLISYKAYAPVWLRWLPKALYGPTLMYVHNVRAFQYAMYAELLSQADSNSRSVCTI